MSDLTLFLRCATCLDSRQYDDIQVCVVPGAVVVECRNHEKPMLVVRIPATTDHILRRGCEAHS